MWEEDLESAARRKVAWFIGIVVAAATGCAGWYWYASRQHPVVATPVVPAAPPPPVSTEPQISHPIAADNAAASAALPALNDSDPVVHDSLAGVLGRHPVEQFLVSQNIVRHLVATVDNLPRRKLAVELRALCAADAGGTGHGRESARAGVRAAVPAVAAVVRGSGLSRQVLQRSAGRGKRSPA